MFYERHHSRLSCLSVHKRRKDRPVPGHPFGLPIFSIYLAHYADRVGKKVFGKIGSFLVAIGYFIILLASFVPAYLTEPATVSGIVVFALGNTFFASSWFALMNPVVPPGMRGRFWGKLRLSWQTVSIILLTVTLGLVPSVMGHARPYPDN